MVEAELKGVQRLPRKLDRQFSAAAVGGVPHHRMIHVSAVHPDLVGAAGVELEPQ